MVSKQYSLYNKYVTKPKLWLRYADDPFIVWTHGRKLLDLFLQQPNNEEESIKFTVDFEKILPCLDVLVSHENR